jgi:hypothetical protein
MVLKSQGHVSDSIQAKSRENLLRQFYITKAGEQDL